MKISLSEQPYDPWQLVANHQKMFDADGKFGAATVFVGSMRDFNLGDDVQSMYLEYYPGMTERYLEKIALQAERQWPLLDVLICHRVGQISPADAIVVTAVWSAHRAEAFEACRFLIEELKHKAPFWKKEHTDKGQRWVAENTPAMAGKSSDKHK